ncbi:putative acetyltransferase [Bacillus sp. TS-2]|nr:putative acetyltransferase [Bacillus sp. TS-2]
MSINDKPIVELVQLKERDVSGLIGLSSSVKWDYNENEIKTILSSGKIFGHKNVEGKVVSSAAVIPYDSSLASIGMVIVDQRFRGMGLGNEVIKKCIGEVSTDTTIMLIATEEGIPIYKKLGFQSVDSIYKFICTDYTALPKPVNDNEFIIDEFSDEHLTEIITLDEAAFGGNRSRFLMNRIRQSEKCFVAKDKQGNILGYGLSILGPVNLVLGPIVAPNSEIALLLVQQLSAKYQGNLRIDVISGHEQFMRILEKSGFVKQNQPPIMVNSVTMPVRNQTLFAVAAQIFG